MPTITAGADTVSDGLTLDTDWGSVDLVAVWRVFGGVPTAVTRAERAYVVDLVAQNPGTVATPIARGLRMSGDSFKRAVNRRCAELRAQGVRA